MDFWFVRSELGEYAAETEGVFAECRAEPVVADRGGVAFVEDEIDNFKNGGEARSAVRATGNLERNLRFSKSALGAHDALGDGRLGDEEGTGDFIGGEAAEQTEGESDARLGRKHRMTGREDQAKEVVSDVIIECSFEIRHGHLLTGLEFASELTMLKLEQFAAAQAIDSAMLRGGHQPGARIVGDAGGGPLLKSGDKSILREFFGEPDVAHDAREAGDDPGGLDPPDRFDGAMCVGSRHGYRSHHVRSGGARRDRVRRWEEIRLGRRAGELQSRPPSRASEFCEFP